MKQLNNRLKDVIIDVQNPFANDALGRKDYAEILTSVVDTYCETGCVMALNGKWGSGKTTFINMWKAYMEGLGYKTILFNAWESDYMDDPLVALVSELQVLNSDKSSLSKVATSVGKIIIAGGSSIVKSFIKNKFGIDSDCVKETIEEAKEIGLKSLDNYLEEKATFEEFKQHLVEYIADNAGDKPVVFFVDELDRCRPDYSVKVLERIKHLFDIPNVVFVLSINKKQLGHAIQGFYGTDNLDADDYLRRFIDIEYALPRPDIEKFNQYLYREYDFDGFLRSKKRLQFFAREDEPGELLSTATKFAKICNLDLRTLDRIFAICRISLQSMVCNNYLLPDVLFLLCLLKVKYSDIYSNISENRYSVQGLIDAIENQMLNNYLPDNNISIYDRTIEYVIATFIINYNNPIRYEPIDKGFVGVKIDGSEKEQYPFTVQRLNADKLNDAFIWVKKNGQEKYHIGLTFAINRIDLLCRLSEE